VPLDSQEQEYYDELKKESILRLNEKDEVTVTNILAEMAKLQQIANGFLNIKEIEEIGEEPETKVEVFGNSKLNELQNIIENLNGSKLVVWCKFRQDIKMIEEMVDEQFETDSVALHGGTSDQSGELQERFHNDPECQVFISQLQAGAKGIDLTAASHCVYYSNSFSLDNYLQSQDRLHREGQDNKVTYIHLISEGTIDEKIHASLEENEEMAKEIMDEYRKDGISDDIFE
jgi:SNF2 family DNA or RNA helicase